MEPEGSGANGVLIVGEAGGYHEETDGLPFRPGGASGAVLRRAIARAGLSYESFGVWNILGCRPPQNRLEGEPYEVGAINHCKYHFREVMRRFKPRVILALGGVAARTLTGYAGPRQGIGAIRGFVLPAIDYPGVLVVCSYHPAFLRRGAMNLLGAMINDINLAVEVAAHGPRPVLPINYIEQPTYEQAKAFRDEVAAHPNLDLAFDIETDYSTGEDEEEVTAKKTQVVMIQFSLRPGEGIAFPWRAGFIELAQEILALPNRKLGFNLYHFDIPIMRDEGAVINGEIVDLMWKWHHAQPDLPRNLQFVASFYDPMFGPWKHLASQNLAGYGCCDVDILQRIEPALHGAMLKRGILRGYENHIQKLWPILEVMSARGLPIDRASQDEFGTKLDALLIEFDTKLQAVYPEHLRNVNPKNGFVKLPKDTAGMIQRDFAVKIALKVPCARCVDSDGVVPKKIEDGLGALIKCPVCKGKGLIKSGAFRTETIRRWCEPLPFKPSQDQIIRYIKWRGHKVPKAIGENRDTTSKLMMDRLAKQTKDPLYSGLLEFRGVQKMKTTYVDNWHPSIQDGRVHAIFKFSPATGQLAATDPNILTMPSMRLKLGSLKLGEEFRKTIQAPDGYVLLAFDYSAFHAMTLAFEAEDADYMRVANIDPHSFLTARMQKLKTMDELQKMGDDELREYLGWVKQNYTDIRDGKAKPTVLGYGFGLEANKMYELNRDSFASKAECSVLIGLLRSTFPKTYEYQINTRLLAHRQGFLLNLHGYIRWFWDVLYRDPVTGESRVGDQAQAAIAFNPACDAHGHIKDVVLRLDRLGLLEKYGLANIVHDEIFFVVKRELLEEAAFVIQPEMERPSTVLVNAICPTGLVVRAEPKVGLNAAEMGSLKKFLKK